MDEIFGTAKNDLLLGNTNLDDIIEARAGNDIARGFGGNDSLYGENGNDLLEGGAGNDLLNGGNGIDVLSGGAGRDVLIGGAGADAIDGGDGTDTAIFNGRASDYLIKTLLGVTVVADLKPKQAGDDGIDTMVNVERLQFADHIVFLKPNAGPVARGDPAQTDEDLAVTISSAALLANDTDANLDPLTIVGVGNGANGTAVLSQSGSITYTPNADFNGTDTFSYTVSDGLGGFSTATVTVTVNPVADEPVAESDSATTDEDTAVGIDVLANDTQPNPGTVVSDVTQGAHGTVAINDDGTITYTPNANFHGTDAFSYTISDGVAQSTALVTVVINPVNDKPVANAAVASGNENTVIPITLTGSDVDAGDSIETFKLSGLPANGTLFLDADMTIPVLAETDYAAVGNQLTLYFKPDTDWAGTSGFQYSANDGDIDGDLAIAALLVRDPEDPLIISNFGIVSTTPNSVTVSWDSDEPSTSKVSVKNVITGVVVESELHPELVTHHVVTVHGLTANTLYAVRGISAVPDVKSSISDERAFRTPR
jgi:VCBS repeat-containing protein